MTEIEDPKELSRRRYSRYADGYVTSTTHARGADLELLVEMAAPRPDWRALDVATGGGHTALAFSARVAEVTATDLTPEMLGKAEKHLIGAGANNVAFRVADAENLPFDAEAFDLVTCRIAPHHFPDCQRFLAESARVLEPGGCLALQDHVLPADQDAARYIDAFEKLRDPSHNRAYSESEWRQMFATAGLVVERVEEVTKRHDLAAWATRQGATAEVLAELAERLRDAPAVAAAWMEIEDLGTDRASFVNHHILIRAVKSP